MRGRARWLSFVLAIGIFMPFSSLHAQANAGRFAIGAEISTLGPGVEAAVSVLSRSNIRAGFNFFNYSDTFHSDGITYVGQLKLLSARLTWDQYFFQHAGGFHVSGGALLYDGNSAKANAIVPLGTGFSLGGTTFYSSSQNPVSGGGTLGLNKAAPMVLVGFGNLVPRNGRHFGISLEAGVVFQGSPDVRLHFAGTACLDPAGTECIDTTDPLFQNAVLDEQKKLNRDLKWFQYYPVVSLAIAYRF